MRNPFKRKPKPYTEEIDRIQKVMAACSPYSTEYKECLARLDQLDRIHNRTTELKKTVIPALGTVGAVTGIYALQQFAGVIVPKALDSLAARQEQKKSQQDD